MKTCENCLYYYEEEFTPEFKQRTDVDGYCEILETGVKGCERVCKRFAEKE